MEKFVVSSEAQHQWMNLGNLSLDGTNIMVRFEPGVGMIVKKTIPERVMNEALQNAEASREIFKKGKVLGNTQNHIVPFYSMPASMREKWKQELGDPRRDPDALKRWKQRLNSSEFQKFRASGHRL